MGSPLAPRFDEQVWQRIARAEETAATPWILFRNWMAEAFARPAMAVGYVTVLLLAGLIALVEGLRPRVNSRAGHENRLKPVATQRVRFNGRLREG